MASERGGEVAWAGRCIVASIVMALSAFMLNASAVWAQSTSTTRAAAASLASTALTPFATQKAERLLREKLACLGCHSIRGEGGKLAPALDDVRGRRSAAYVASIIREPQQVVPGAAMPRVEMLATERDLIIRYFGGDPSAPIASAVATAAPNASSAASGRAANGAELYGKWCAGCHGVKGGGDGANARSLPVPPTRHADAKVTSLRSDDALFDTIHGGGAIMNRSARMPAFGGSLTSTEIRALVRYIRALCACDGPTWSRGGGA